MQILYHETHDDEEIMVYDTSKIFGKKGRFRVLQFSDQAVQGAMDLNRPESIFFEYPRAIIHLVEHNRPSFEHLFIIGHGIGTIAAYFSHKQVKTAELSEKVLELSKQYFGYSGDNVRIGDGLQILKREEQELYDFIILDAFTSNGTPKHLTSRYFFKLTREKLNPTGAIMLNLIGRRTDNEFLKSVHAALHEQYKYIKTFSFATEEAHDIKNIIMAASNHPIQFQERSMAGFMEYR